MVKHITKRIGIFMSFLIALITFFYVRSFFSMDGFEIFEFYISIFFLFFFAIAFLFFEASELKSKKEFESRKFNLITAVSMIIILLSTLVLFIRGAVYLF